MELVRRTVILAIASVVLTSLASADAPQFSPFSGDMQITSSSEGGPHDMAGKIFVGHGHMRLDMAAGGHQSASITDFATKTTDMLMIDQKMYVEYTANQMARPGARAKLSDGLKPYDPEHPCASQPDVTCKKIGVETVSGRPCDHWEVTDKNGKITNLWIDQKLHFPIKLASQDSTILLSNITEGEPNASLFRVPSDFQRMDARGKSPGPMPRPPKN
jgi:uncharacterized protein DUF4412